MIMLNTNAFHLEVYVHLQSSFTLRSDMTGQLYVVICLGMLFGLRSMFTFVYANKLDTI